MEKATEHNKQWKKVKLGDLISDSYAGGTPNRARNDYFGGDIPWVSSGEVNNPIIDSTIENITQVGLNNSSARWIPENSILLALYGATAGQVSMLKIRATANQAVLAIIPNNEVVDTQFLFYQIFHNKQSLLFLAQGSGQPNLSKSIVDRLDISYPDSLPAQRRIAAILSTADKVIEQTRQLIGKYKSIKQGMMEDLLKPKEGWKKVKLGEVCDRITDGSHDSPKAIEDGYFMPSVKDMSYNCFDFSSCKQISEYDYLRLKSSGCKPDIGDVLIAKDGSILKYCFVVEEDLPIVILSSIAILKPKQATIDSHFLSYYFQKRDVVNDVVENYRSGTGVPRIVLRNFEKIEIAYPDALQEQRRIVKILSGIDRKIEAEEKVLEKYEKVKKGLMEKLLNE